MQTWWRFICDWTCMHVPLLGDQSITSDPTIWIDQFSRRRVELTEYMRQNILWTCCCTARVHTLTTLMLWLISRWCGVAAIRIVVWYRDWVATAADAYRRLWAHSDLIIAEQLRTQRIHFFFNVKQFITYFTCWTCSTFPSQCPAGCQAAFLLIVIGFLCYSILCDQWI